MTLFNEDSNFNETMAKLKALRKRYSFHLKIKNYKGTLIN